MPTPTLSSFEAQLFNTVGQAIAGAIIAVLEGQVDTVDVATQPGSPLATIYADPYGYSQIPQAPIALSGTVTTVAGSPNVSYASGSQLSAFLVNLTITINGVQYTVLSIDPTAGALVLATNALSSGTFAWSATIPTSQMSAVPGFGVSDGGGNFQFWVATGYYVYQIYSPIMPEQFIQGISVGGSGGGGGGVSSLNSLVGAVELIAGSNITITESGDDIIISASGSGGGGVTSLNSLTGALTLTPLHGLSVSASGSVIDIANTQQTPSLNLQNYGGIPKPYPAENATTSVNTTGGSPNITVGSALTYFQNGSGVCIWEAGAATAQSTPSTPTITSPVISGAQTIKYQVVGVDKQCGLTAASSAGAASAPAIFGPVPQVISSITAAAGVVTVNFSSALNTTVAPGMTIHIVGVTGAGAGWNGIWTIATAPSTVQVTYALAAASGTGTVSVNSTGRLSNTQLITAISRDSSGVISLTTAEPHNWIVAGGRAPTVVIIENASPITLNGHFVLATVPTTTTATLYSTGNLNAVTGLIQTNNPTNPFNINLQNATNATVWEYTVVDCGALSGTTTQYYIYSDNASPGGALQLIGKTLYGERHFVDWGPFYGGGFTARPYVPTTPPPVSPQNQLFSTTILSGGGTTSMVLAANVPTGVTGGTILYDDAPCLKNACAALPPAASDGGGAVLLSPPYTNGLTVLNSYVINSPVNIPSNVNLIFAVALGVSETVYLGNGSSLLGDPSSQYVLTPSFSVNPHPLIAGIASPLVQVGSIANANMAGFVAEDVTFWTTGGNGQYGLSIMNGFYLRINNCAFQSNTGTSGGTNVPLMFNGSNVDVNLSNLTVDGSSIIGDQQPIGQSCFGPLVGNVVFRASDNPINSFSMARVNISGVNDWFGRGLVIDGQYENEPTYSYDIGWIWNQGPTMPCVIFIGHAECFQIAINECVNDSEQTAILANLSDAMYNVSVLNSEIDAPTPVTTGNAIIGLTVDGYQSQNANQTTNLRSIRYGQANVGSVSVTPPFESLISNTHIQSLGSSGVLFAAVSPDVANVSAVPSGSGTFAAGIWYVSVTFVGWDGGETGPSNIFEVTLNGSQGMQVSFTIPSGFQGAYIYTTHIAGNSGNRNVTLYTSSPQTLSATGTQLSSEPLIDGSGLPFMGQTQIITPLLVLPSGLNKLSVLSPTMTANRTMNFADGANSSVVSTRLTTTAGGSPYTVTLPGLTSSSHISITPLNAAAAADMLGVYAAVPTTNTVVITTSSAAGEVFDIIGTVN